ncbi:MAG: hypothetical protein P4L44_13450 [Oryzomonas sp.]|nr:hypothetical protein [Oryzomonas sp.]MDR3580960.1 hypothetical protein [Oryzomonas sp.]
MKSPIQDWGGYRTVCCAVKMLLPRAAGSESLPTTNRTGHGGQALYDE